MSPQQKVCMLAAKNIVRGVTSAFCLSQRELKWSRVHVPEEEITYMADSASILKEKPLP